MPRYIDADETIELLRSLGSRDYRREKGTICDAIKMLQYPEYTPTADVVPKSEVACELVGLYEKCASKIPHHIRRIFKDDRNFEDGFREGKTDSLIEVLALIAELKKKYTEGGTECQ